MKLCPFTLPAGAVLLALAAGFAAAPALAAAPADAALTLYRQERAACESGQSLQGHAACIDEAQSAYAQNRRGALDDHDIDYSRNAQLRCGALKGSEQTACAARMRGEGSTRGSAAAGGIYRELTTRTVGEPAVAPAPP
jgi:hypothetical protein